MNEDTIEDVIIVGGGPAGLSAALFLGRCLRRVVICDAGRPRNESSPAMHGFLSRDGIPPKEFLQECRDQLGRYDSVMQVSGTIKEVERAGELFVARDSDGRQWKARAILIATGLIDRLPDVPGVAGYYGTSVHHCPYCDGFENRGRKLGVIGSDLAAIELAQELLQWSPDITLFTNSAHCDPRKVIAPGIKIVGGEITRLQGDGKQLEAVVTAGRHYQCEALFFSPAQARHSDLAENLGCRFEGGTFSSGAEGQTHVTGLFVAGNASKGIQMAIVAAAEGLKTAVAINTWLIQYERSYLASPREI